MNLLYTGTRSDGTSLVPSAKASFYLNLVVKDRFDLKQILNGSPSLTEEVMTMEK